MARRRGEELSAELSWRPADEVQVRHLDDDLARMAEGIDTVIGPRGLRLSGGQVKRVAAARVFVRGTPLLVCDDLSSALDAPTDELIWRRLLDAEADGDDGGDGDGDDGGRRR